MLVVRVQVDGVGRQSLEVIQLMSGHIPGRSQGLILNNIENLQRVTDKRNIAHSILDHHDMADADGFNTDGLKSILNITVHHGTPYTDQCQRGFQLEIIRILIRNLSGNGSEYAFCHFKQQGGCRSIRRIVYVGTNRGLAVCALGQRRFIFKINLKLTAFKCDDGIPLENITADGEWPGSIRVGGLGLTRKTDYASNGIGNIYVFRHCLLPGILKKRC